jgi:hypothetical protein
VLGSCPLNWLLSHRWDLTVSALATESTHSGAYYLDSALVGGADGLMQTLVY